MTGNHAWPIIQFGDIAEFRNGLNFLSSESGNIVPMLGVADFKNRESIGEGYEFSSVTPAREMTPDDFLSPNDLVFVRSNGSKSLVGRCLLYEGPGMKTAISGFTIRARVLDASVDPTYLSKVMQSSLFRSHLLEQGGGSSINNLSQTALAAFKFPLPPLPEQCKIAEILRTWDAAIERVESKSVQLLQRRTGLVNELIFGHGWPHGVVWPETAPDWDIRPIGKVAVDVSSRNVDLTATDVLTCSKHRGFVRSTDYFARTVHSADLSNYKIIRRGQFGYPSNHIEEGSIGLQNVVDVGVVSPIYTVFEFDSSLVDADFAYLTLKTRAYAHMFAVSTSSSVDRRGSLRWPAFSKLPFPVPPLDEQRRIAAIASEADREVELVLREVELLRTQKRGLMRKLLTGQVRVDVAGEIEPEGDDNE